ncbi:MAG: hypothetical protein U0L20_01580 [Ruminococcus sp.]|nr:hypothetical protein [Ruminococcus sp.]
MFSVNSSVNLNFKILKQLEDNAIKALENTADALLEEVKNAQVMPFETGNLQNENTFVDYSNSANGVISIVSDTPYARRLYFHPEFNYNRDENIAAGGKWFIPWQKGGTRENFCVEAFAEIYKRLCKL